MLYLAFCYTVTVVVDDEMNKQKSLDLGDDVTSGQIEADNNHMSRKTCKAVE